MANDEKKIFIDEDWKSQVEREKTMAAQPPAAPAPAPTGEAPLEDDLTLFEGLVSGLSAQALYALGLVAQEDQQQVMVDLGMAQHLIETLGMLKEKTAGNLSPRESDDLTQALGELQRAFAVRVQQVQQAQTQQPPPNISLR